MAAIQVPTGYKTLVKAVAHAFYSGDCPPKEPPPPPDPTKEAKPLSEAQLKKQAQANTNGLAIILLTALTERQWVKEDDLAQDVNLHAKTVRKAMRYLEQEQLVQREHRKETAFARRKQAAALEKAGLNKNLTLTAATAARTGVAQAPEEQQGDDEEEEPQKVQVVTYCCLDYPRMLDMLTYRFAKMAAHAKKVAEGGSTVQYYRCPQCTTTYDSMQVLELMEAAGQGSVELRCMVCQVPVELAVEGGTEQARKERVRRMRETSAKLETALQPLQRLLREVTSVKAPDFMSYSQWVTLQVNLQTKMQQAPPAADRGAGSIRPAYGAGTSNLRMVDADMLLEVNLGGDAPAAAANQGYGRAAAAAGSHNAGAAAAAAAGGGGRPPRPGAASPAAAAAAAVGSSGTPGKAQPPWLARNGAQASPSASGSQSPQAAAAAAAGGSPGSSQLTEAQRKAAFLQQTLGKAGRPAAAGGAAAAAGPSGKPLPPWLAKSSVSGQLGMAAALASKPGVLPGVLAGVGAGIKAGLGGMVGLAASIASGAQQQGLKRGLDELDYKQDHATQQAAAAAGASPQEQDRKRFKPDPDQQQQQYEPPLDDSSTAVQQQQQQEQQHEEEPAAFDDTIWEDVVHEPEGPAGGAADGGSGPQQRLAAGPVSHPIEAADDDVEWEDVE